MKTSAIFTIIAIAMTLNLNATNNHGEPNNKTTGDAYLSEMLYAFEEKALDVSDWMIDIEAFAEPNLLIVEWMLDTSLLDEYEELIEIEESWMLDVDAFRGMETDFEEDDIEVEDWMLSVTSFNDIFYEEMCLVEEWMFNF